MRELKVLIEEQKLQKRIVELAKQIEEEYKDKKLVLVCVLKGSVFFTVDLAKKINQELEIEFIQVSSYKEGTVSCGNVDLNLDIIASLEEKDVLIVEDIIDTGRTLKYLIELLKNKNPNSIKLCTLLDKPERREHEIKVDYVGFEIPNEFVVGYGLDYNEKYRNLPYIGYFEK